MSLKTIRRRLADLAPAEDNECKCGNVRVIHRGEDIPPGEDPEPERCPNCGGERLTVIIEHVKDWRGYGQQPR